MCIPTSAPHRVRHAQPIKSSQKTELVSSDADHSTTFSKVPAVSELESDCSDAPVANYQNGSHDQPTVGTSRREKSRLAAKARRKNENQALIYLRLALPIQLSGRSNPPSSFTSPDAPNHLDASTACDKNASSVLHSMPNYRKASTVSRQQRLPTPEFEKAVTIRLASSSLCLYNRLYSPLRCSGRQPHSCCKRPQPPPTSQLTSGIGSPASMSLHSRSFVAVLVDVSEKTIVYAPPAFAQLLGLSWNITIGLQLHEIRLRQFLLSGHNSPAWSNTPVTSWSIQKAHNRSRYQTDLPADNQVWVDRQWCSSNKPPVGWQPCVDDAGNYSADRPDLITLDHCNGACDIWRRGSSHNVGRAQPVGSLLPPRLRHQSAQGKTCARPNRMSVRMTNDSGQVDVEAVYAVCWASALLPSLKTRYPKHADRWGSAVAPSFLLPPGPDHSSLPVNSSTLGSPKVTTDFVTGRTSVTRSALPSSGNSGDLVLCLLQPIPLTDLLGPESEPDGPHVTRSTSFVHSLPRSYHRPDTLSFLTADPSVLSAFFPSIQGLQGQVHLRNFSLVDLIHLDELDHFVEDVAFLSMGQPLTTSFLRLKTRTPGIYRFARLVLFLVPRTLVPDELVTPTCGDDGVSSLRDSGPPVDTLSVTSPSSLVEQQHLEDSTVVVCCYQLAHLTPNTGDELSYAVRHPCNRSCKILGATGKTFRSAGASPLLPLEEEHKEVSPTRFTGNDILLEPMYCGYPSAPTSSLPVVSYTTTMGVNCHPDTRWPDRCDLPADSSSSSRQHWTSFGGGAIQLTCQQVPHEEIVCQSTVDYQPNADYWKVNGTILSPGDVVHVDRSKYFAPFNVQNMEDEWTATADVTTVPHGDRNTYHPQSMAANSRNTFLTDLQGCGSQGSSTASASPYSESCSSSPAQPFGVQTLLLNVQHQQSPATPTYYCHCNVCVAAGQLLPQAEVLPVSVTCCNRRRPVVGTSCASAHEKTSSAPLQWSSNSAIDATGTFSCVRLSGLPPTYTNWVAARYPPDAPVAYAALTAVAVPENNGMTSLVGTSQPGCCTAYSAPRVAVGRGSLLLSIVEDSCTANLSPSACKRKRPE